MQQTPNRQKQGAEGDFNYNDPNYEQHYAQQYYEYNQGYKPEQQASLQAGQPNMNAAPASN